MKIVFVNRFFSPDLSATSQLLSDLAFHLAKSGAQVHVVTGRHAYDDPNTTLPRQDFIQGVRITRIWTTHFGRQSPIGRMFDYLTFYSSAAWGLLVLLKQGDVVVAKTDPPLISVIATIIAKMRGTKLVNWIQDLFPEIAAALEVKGMRGVGPLLKIFRNLSLKAAKLNVVLGNRMAQRLLDEGIPHDQIRVIHNWADGAAIQPIDREKNHLRAKWNLHDKVVVGYSGNFGRAHEFETILSAAEILLCSNAIVFLFIGDGAQLPWMRRHVEERQLRNVVFKPYQPRENLSMSLGVPDVHLISLQPSMEGLIVPSKFYGIAAAGRPILYIGSTTGEITELVREAQCGFSVNVNEAQKAATIIRTLAERDDERRQLGLHARSLFDKRFDKSYALTAWKTALEEVT